MRTLIAVSALLLAAAVALTAMAGATPARSQPSDWNFGMCVTDHAACAERCRAKHDDGKGGAACLIGCATDEVECVAGRTASGVTPWIERKTEQFRNFLDDFLRDLPIRPDDKPSPSPPSGPDYDRTAI